MEYFVPSCLAARQQTRFISSLVVAAMMMSVSSAPASTSVRRFAPLPMMHKTSSVSLALRRACLFLSMIVMSWPSRES